MFKLRVVQALHGDCLILEYGSEDDRHYMLVDGGPGKVYDGHLKGELTGIRDQAGQLDLVVLSHVDDDHVNGLLDLLHDLIKQRRDQKQETIKIGGLWHNSFGQTLGQTAERGLKGQMDEGPLVRGSMPSADIEARSIGQGQDLTASARGLQIPINFAFRDTPDRLVCVENCGKPIQMANLNIKVVGPTHGTLHALQKEWEEWLEKQKKVKELPPARALAAARELDKSVPNLSSIMFLVTAEDKTLLLTGDGTGEHLLAGLHQAGLLGEEPLFVDVFKLPHHGSARNVTPQLFERIIAKTYLVCADGSNDNPDFATLEWLVQAAIKQNRSFDLVVTTEAENVKALVEKYPPEKNNYRLYVMEAGAHSITVTLSEKTPQMTGNLLTLKGIGPVFADRLFRAGISTPAQIMALTSQQLASILRTGPRRAESIYTAAKFGSTEFVN